MAEENHGQGKAGLEELAYLERLYQDQYMLVTNAVNAAMEELQELNSAGKSVENIGVVAGKEAFSSIGGDFYVMARIKENKSVVAGVGGGYLVEKDAESAKRFIKERIERKNAMISKLLKSRKELEAAVMELGSKMESMAKGYGNV
jgi:prefoldin alpha subunit